MAKAMKIFSAFFIMIAIASAAALSAENYNKGKYIDWRIEEYSNGRWKELSPKHIDDYSQAHCELESLWPSCGGGGHYAKNYEGEAAPFVSNSFRVYPNMGKKYQIKIRNRTDCRIAVVAGVDGKNSVNSRDTHGDYSDVAWVIGARDTTIVKGFQSGDRKAMEFFWTTPEGAHSDKTYEIGAIKLYVFFEKGRCSSNLLAGSCTEEEYYKGKDKEGRSSAKTGSPSGEIGTGAGDEVYSPVEQVDFNRLTRMPEEAVKVVYSSGVPTSALRFSSNCRGYEDTSPWRNDYSNSGCYPGIGVHVGSTDYSGVPVTGTIHGGPAWKAGITEGDTIVKAGNETISSYDDLKRAINRLDKGDYITIEYIHKGNKSVISIKIDTICP